MPLFQIAAPSARRPESEFLETLAPVWTAMDRVRAAGSVILWYMYPFLAHTRKGIRLAELLLCRGLVHRALECIRNSMCLTNSTPARPNVMAIFCGERLQTIIFVGVGDGIHLSQRRVQADPFLDQHSRTVCDRAQWVDHRQNAVGRLDDRFLCTNRHGASLLHLATRLVHFWRSVDWAKRTALWVGASPSSMAIEAGVNGLCYTPTTLRRARSDAYVMHM